MSKGRPTEYYVLYTVDGEVKELISTLKPSIICEVLESREVDRLHLDIRTCDLIAETDTIKSQTSFTLEEVEAMEKHHIKTLVSGLLSHDEMEDLKNWF